MENAIFVAARMLCVMTGLMGVAYPCVMTGLAQWVFPWQANGSVLQDASAVIGSELLGQEFIRPEYFWGRLSATESSPYNGLSSSGSNRGPLHPALQEAAQERLGRLTQVPPTMPLAVDLLTSSASGLDPHISPAAAQFQVPRIAAARGLKEQQVREMIEQSTEQRQWLVMGAPRVHLLKLNLALDRHTRNAHE